jgi:hypothetical protein
VHAEVCPEFLSDTVWRLGPKDPVSIELNTLDLLEEPFDVPSLVIHDRQFLRWRLHGICDRGHQSIQFVFAIRDSG